MLAPSDYKDLLKILNKHRVKYLIIGAYAVIYYTEPRYTKDFDIWVKAEIGNAKKLYKALTEFGAPLQGVTVQDFTKRNIVYQMGVAPVRIDILAGIEGLNFDRAWCKRKIIQFENIKTNMIDINDLIKAKAKINRPSDKQDIRNLRSVAEKKR